MGEGTTLRDARTKKKERHRKLIGKIKEEMEKLHQNTQEKTIKKPD